MCYDYNIEYQIGGKNNMEKQTESLATEMLRELKASSKRKDIIIIILILCIFISNIFWVVRNTQYETITEEEQYMEDIDNSSDSSYIQTIN